MMRKIDLHIHTSCSDGTINIMNDRNTWFVGYDLIAITDHENLFNPQEFRIPNCKTKFISGWRFVVNTGESISKYLDMILLQKMKSFQRLFHMLKKQRLLAIDTIIQNSFSIAPSKDT